jgi:predicted transcriptional regulator
MGITKIEGFSEKTTRMAETLKAVGHPARLSILEFLVKTPSCICGDIVDELPLAQSTVSRHLSELKKVGLIKGEINGSAVCYCLDEDAWNVVTGWFSGMKKELEACC